MKKKYFLTEAFKEDVGYTPEKANQLLDKVEKDLPALEQQAEKLNNILQGVAVGDLLEPGGEEKVGKLSRIYDALDKKISDYKRIIDDVKETFEDDDSIFSKADKLDTYYWTFGTYVDALGGICDKLEVFVSGIEEYNDTIKKYDSGKTN